MLMPRVTLRRKGGEKESRYENSARIIARLNRAYFLSGFGREVEDEDAEEGDEHCGQDQVDGVEEGLSADGDVEGDVCLRRLGVVVDVQEGGHLRRAERVGLLGSKSDKLFSPQ